MYRRNKLRSACYFVLNGALATAIVLAALSTYAALPATTAGALDPTFNSVAPYDSLPLNLQTQKELP